MTDFIRTLKLDDLLKKKSFFLFGPRSTGKSTLIKNLFPQKTVINLLKQETYLKLSAQPSLLEEMIEAIEGVIIIDEIQKIPELLDEVHRLIEEKKRIFLLTGSSARKLKNKGVNLLAGRAWQANLFPLTSHEIISSGEKLSLEKILQYGTLPQVYLAPEPGEELDAYTNTYLKEEIREEGVVQNLAAFSRFLKVAALTSSQLVNYSSIASDTGIPASSIRNYYQILQDTWVGILIEPWRESKKRKAIDTPKFYFFDTGVTNLLRGHQQVQKNSVEFGELFEQFIAIELQSYLSYRRIKKSLHFWRTHTKIEVDFVIEDLFCVEVKATESIQPKHLNGLRALQEEKNLKGRKIMVSLDQNEKVTSEGIECMHWKLFLQRLWNQKFE